MMGSRMTSLGRRLTWADLVFHERLPNEWNYGKIFFSVIWDYPIARKILTFGHDQALFWESEWRRNLSLYQGRERR